MARDHGSEVKGPQDAKSHYYDSLGELAAAVDEIFKRPGPRHDGLVAADERKPAFYGHDFPNFAALRGAIDRGWQKGAATIETLRAEAGPAIDRIRERSEELVFDVSGQWLDVGRMLDGEPECFGSFAQVDYGGGSSKVIRVDINIACSCGVSPEQFARRGAAAAAFVDLLESSGRRVELHAVAGIYGNRVNDPIKRSQLIRVKIKSASEPLDLSRVAVAIVDPGVFRRMMLAVAENEGVNSGRSYPAPYRGSLLPPEHADFANVEDAIVFDQMHLGALDEAGGFRPFLARSLEKLGINVEGLFAAD
jgi:hypothetical protein